MDKNNIINKLKETNKFDTLKKILASKNYDELYTLFGKNIYGLFTPFSYKREDIKRLMENKDYSTIYNKYGSIERIFIKNFRKAKKEEINRLLDEKRYIELYTKYGKTVYDYEKEITSNDIFYETGSTTKVKLYKAKRMSTKGLKSILLGLEAVTFATILLIGEFRYFVHDNYNQKLEENISLIQQYDYKISNYASSVKELNLDNDLDIIMKVMDDMWNAMEGYGKPKLDIANLGRLDFTEENGVGVCRNISDDFSARMNAINPEYNARNITVFLNSDDYSKESLANIETRFVDNDNNENEENNTEDSVDITQYFGNHMVSILQPTGKDYTLVIDPTNPSIGIIVNGEIYMFSTENGKGLTFKPLGQILGAIDCENVLNDFSTSYIKHTTKETLEQLSLEWGIHAQNESLEKVRNIESKQL